MMDLLEFSESILVVCLASDTTSVDTVSIEGFGAVGDFSFCCKVKIKEPVARKVVVLGLV